jgi:3-phosphoshikimate 1-carboxyvinyltransferase
MSSQSVDTAKSLRGTITLSPDKSIAQRAAIFSLLHEGPSNIHNYSQAQDPQTTLKCVVTKQPYMELGVKGYLLCLMN